MNRSNNRVNIAVILLIVLVNITLIFFGAQFLHSFAPGKVFISSIVVFGFGLLGLLTVIVLTSRLKSVLKTTLLITILAGGGFGARYYWTHHENIVENYYAIAIVGGDTTEVRFIEFYFNTDYALRRFIDQTPWYMGDPGLKERKQMLDYYYSVKAEEKEDKKEIIERRYLNVAPMPNKQWTLLAYVSQYRTGPFVAAGNPIYNIDNRAERESEEE